MPESFRSCPPTDSQLTVVIQRFRWSGLSPIEDPQAHGHDDVDWNAIPVALYGSIARLGSRETCALSIRRYRSSWWWRCRRVASVLPASPSSACPTGVTWVRILGRLLRVQRTRRDRLRLLLPLGGEPRHSVAELNANDVSAPLCSDREPPEEVIPHIGSGPGTAIDASPPHSRWQVRPPRAVLRSN